MMTDTEFEYLSLVAGMVQALLRYVGDNWPDSKHGKGANRIAVTEAAQKIVDLHDRAVAERQAALPARAITLRD